MNISMDKEYTLDGQPFTQKFAYICQGCGGIYWAKVDCDCNTKAAFDLVAVSNIAQPVQQANITHFTKRCRLSEQCLPDAPYRKMLVALHEEMLGTQISNQHALLCAETYQVVGSLLSDLRQFDTGKGRKVLDNLSQGCVVHNNVLPWPSFVKVIDEFSIADLALEYFGEYSEKHYDFAVSLLDLDNVEVRGIK